MANKILLIRMLDFGDVAAIALPALRYYQQKHPEAEIHLLTYGQGEELVKVAMPEVKVLALKQNQWPPELVNAMQQFLGLAEDILAEEYSQIVNLDTAFMPCFLARFLKDAGEPVSGNYMSMSVPGLVDCFQNQTLDPDYVNLPVNYIQSSWLSMNQWHSAWWEHGEPPALGYAEFYLRRCCGFADINMDLHIDVKADKQLARQEQPVVALCSRVSGQEIHYQYNQELVDLLKHLGVIVWQVNPDSLTVPQLLARLKASQLLVTIPSSSFWLAKAVELPTLLISGQIEPKTLMPDYATDPSDKPVEAQIIAEGVMSILGEL